MYEVVAGEACVTCRALECEMTCKKELDRWRIRRDELMSICRYNDILYSSSKKAMEDRIPLDIQQSVRLFEAHLMKFPRGLCRNASHDKYYMCKQCWRDPAVPREKKHCPICKRIADKEMADEMLKKILKKQRQDKKRQEDDEELRRQEEITQARRKQEIAQEQRQREIVQEQQQRQNARVLREQQNAERLRQQKLKQEHLEQQTAARIGQQKLKDERFQKQLQAQMRRDAEAHKVIVQPTPVVNVVVQTRDVFASMDEYKRVLSNGGMRYRNKTTMEENNPWPHQMHAVNKLLQHNGLPFLIVNHEMGTGKTATVFQMYAALVATQMYNPTQRYPTLIISVPSTTMEQWRVTARNWLNLKDAQGSHNDYVLTTNSSDELQANFPNKKIIITTPGCLTQIHRRYYQWYTSAFKTKTDRWKGGWLAKGGRETDFGVEFDHVPVLGFPFGTSFDMLVIDEVQKCKNPKTAVAHLHHEIATMCRHRVLLSGTIVCNKPEDLAGIAYSGDCPSVHPGISSRHDFQDPSTFIFDCKKYQTVSRQAILQFQSLWIHRVAVKDCNVYLPPLLQQAVDFKVNFTAFEAGYYNDLCDRLRKAFVNIQDGPSSSTSESFLSILTKMCFHIVHPIINLSANAQYEFKSDDYLFDLAIENPSSSMLALLTQLRKMKTGPRPHKRIVVASNFVIPLELAKRWIDKYFSNEFGKTFMFTGKTSLGDRETNKNAFLTADNSIMFLNILAGGVGLHLVPGCEGMIFWGGLPYSPAGLDQCVARIQRFGQTAPITGSIDITYLFPYASRDYGIGNLHRDKRRVMDFTHDQDDSGFDSHDDNVWRKSISIIKDCSMVNTTNAQNPFLNFPDMPLFTTPDELGNISEFQLMHGVLSSQQSAQLLRPANTASMEATVLFFLYCIQMNDPLTSNNIVPVIHDHYGCYNRDKRISRQIVDPGSEDDL